MAAYRRPGSSTTPDVSAGSRAIQMARDARTFHAAELHAVFACWGGSRDSPNS